MEWMTLEEKLQRGAKEREKWRRGGRGQTSRALLTSAFCFAGKASRDDSCWQSAFLLVLLELNAGAHTPASVYWTACLVCGGFQMWSRYVAQAGLKVAVHPRQVSESFCLLLPSSTPMAVYHHAQATGKFLTHSLKQRGSSQAVRKIRISAWNSYLPHWLNDKHTFLFLFPLHSLVSIFCLLPTSFWGSWEEKIEIWGV